MLTDNEQDLHYLHDRDRVMADFPEEHFHQLPVCMDPSFEVSLVETLQSRSRLAGGVLNPANKTPSVPCTLLLELVGTYSQVEIQNDEGAVVRSHAEHQICKNGRE